MIFNIKSKKCRIHSIKRDKINSIIHQFVCFFQIKLNEDQIFPLFCFVVFVEMSVFSVENKIFVKISTDKKIFSSLLREKPFSLNCALKKKNKKNNEHNKNEEGFGNRLIFIDCWSNHQTKIWWNFRWVFLVLFCLCILFIRNSIFIFHEIILLFWEI